MAPSGPTIAGVKPFYDPLDNTHVYRFDTECGFCRKSLKMSCTISDEALYPSTVEKLTVEVEGIVRIPSFCSTSCSSLFHHLDDSTQETLLSEVPFVPRNNYN